MCVNMHTNLLHRLHLLQSLLLKQSCPRKLTACMYNWWTDLLSREISSSAIFWSTPPDRQTDQPTNRLTDHATRSVTIDCIYVCSTGDAVYKGREIKNKNRYAQKEWSGQESVESVLRGNSLWLKVFVKQVGFQLAAKV